MTRLTSLIVAVAVGGGLGSADEPPREKEAPDKAKLARQIVLRYELNAQLAATRAAEDLAQLNQAEAVLRRATLDRTRADIAFAAGTVTAADRDAARAAEDLARIGATQLRRLSDKSAGENRTARERFAFAARRDGADVTGILAVEVLFPDADRPKVADATRGLILAATFATDGTPAAWDAAKRQAHVHVRFPTPHRAVKGADVQEVALAEALVLLPLTREPGGSVLVRSGERVVRFAKYPHAECVKFQEALTAATPAR